MGPSLSIAMCTYNGARFLNEQLESIAAQTKSPHELVVCDDGSADKTIQVLTEFASRAYFPVRIERNDSNLGPTRNFEKVIGLCKGDIVMLSDQDDIWRPRKVEILEKALYDNPAAGYVFSDAEIVDAEGRSLHRGLWSSTGFHGDALRNFRESGQVPTLLRRNVVTGATMAFRAKLAASLRPFSSSFLHDYWIAMMFSCEGRYGVPIDAQLMQYRQHCDQQAGARRESILQKVRRVRKEGPLNHDILTEGYREMRDRLAATEAGDAAAKRAHLLLLDERIMHGCRRADAHRLIGSTKIRSVFRELLTGRYSRFSNSWHSIIEDLCF